MFFALQFLYFKTIFADYVMIELEFAIYKVCFADFTGFDDDTQKPYIYSLSIAVDKEYCWMLYYNFTAMLTIDEAATSLRTLTLQQLTIRLMNFGGFHCMQY